MGLAPRLVRAQRSGDGPARAAGASPCIGCEAPARLILDEKKFRFLLNQDAMATEKLAEGIRLFAKDLHALRGLVRNILQRADAA